MRDLAQVFTSLIVVIAVFGGGAEAQEQPAVQPAKAATPAFGYQNKPLVPLKVQIVVSRFQDDKKVNSFPYTLMVNANDGVLPSDGHFSPHRLARLRSSADVPVATAPMPKESPVQGPASPVNYHSISTNIECYAYSLDVDRFKIDISIEDTSIYAEGQTAQGARKSIDMPSFRTFQSNNAVILKDGQSMQFTMAADKVSGEVTKVDVTVTVEKSR